MKRGRLLCSRDKAVSSFFMNFWNFGQFWTVARGPKHLCVQKALFTNSIKLQEIAAKKRSTYVRGQILDFKRSTTPYQLLISF